MLCTRIKDGKNGLETKKRVKAAYISSERKSLYVYFVRIRERNDTSYGGMLPPSRVINPVIRIINGANEWRIIRISKRGKLANSIWLEKLGDWPTDREIQWQFMRPDRVVHFASGTKLSNYERFEETFQVFLFFFRSR